MLFMYSNLRRIQDAKVDGKVVLVRTNFDVPIKDGEIEDNIRIVSAVDTLKYLLERNCKIVLLSHMGRPGGKAEDKFSLMDTRFELGKLIDNPIKFAHVKAAGNSIKFMNEGDVILLENVRFHEEEFSEDEAKRKAFLKELVDVCDIFVNEAFGAYRPSASTYDIAKLLPSYAGLHLQKEIENLNNFRNNIESPSVAVLGGSKVDTKVGLIEVLFGKFDKILIGGAMAYAFLKSLGVSVGKSAVDDKQVKEAARILKEAKKRNVEIVLPIDHVGGEAFDENTKDEKINSQEIPSNLYGLDIGPKTVELYCKHISESKTTLWNGPMGVFEWDKFSKGTEGIGECITLSTSADCLKVAGGGDTTLAIKKLRIKVKRLNHISVGGGMFIKFLGEGKFEILDVLEK